jgi:hypothetical protein
MADGTLTTTTSDIRLKENIEPLNNSLEKVLKLQGVNYTWKSDSLHIRKIGFIAQDMEKVFPEFVFTNPNDGYKGINYPDITAVLTEAIKEQQKQIEDLKTTNLNQQNKIEFLESNSKDIEQIKKENVELKAEIEKIKQMLESSAKK